MPMDRREAMRLIGLAAAPLSPIAAAPQSAANLGSRHSRRSPGAQFTPDWASLVEGYVAPEWYRDAKFGIWAHWSAQCVPEEGDWYARNMYRQGSRAYKAHVAKFGHPSRFGFMELDNLWRAENWNPERLLDLYVRAGAKYFVALANHHDNFDAYASTYQPWNSTRIGPRKDIVGTWAEAARRRGLRFGVSNHSAHAWHWLQTAYGYDPEGPMQGQRYDAARLTKADGKGKWWDGLDPQQLYAGNTMGLPDGIQSIAEANVYHERVDGIWDETAPRVNPAFARNWALRCRELIDKYTPDLLYFDNSRLPMQQYGLEIAARFYNASMARNGGSVQTVINCKNMPAEWRMALVEDVERGGKPSIQTYPWQTDTCLGDWHYDRALYERNGYKTAANIIHTLCDVVSKNGNLLLNVPVRGDGTIDEKEERIVSEIGAWMTRYGAAIHRTRPWRIHAEGPTKPTAGSFNEGGPESPYTAADVRYVRQGDDVHALVLGWPSSGTVRLTTWANGNPVARGTVEKVTIVGQDAPLRWRRTASALEVTLPAEARNAIGIPLVLSGTELTTGSVA